MAEGIASSVATKNSTKGENKISTVSTRKIMPIDSLLEDISKAINDCNVIRYASYRTASKMQVFHRALNMQYVQVELIAGIFERHRLSVTENSVNLDIHEVEDVLSDIYFAAQKENNVNFNIESCTKLATNYVFRIFNCKLEDTISVFSVKVALTVISCGRLEEKYGYLFHQLADHNACLSKASLHVLLLNICKITETLGESVAYGNHLINASIVKCFNETQGCVGVTEAEFATWLMQEPPLLMWITTLNRMKSAEQISHGVKCSSCKMNPIKGPRYSCLKCSGYNQCQTCFLYGKTSAKHKLRHPVREYCIRTNSKQLAKLIFELIRNKFRVCSKNISSSNMDESIGMIDQTQNFDSMSVRSTIKRRILNDPQKELQSIISHLEDENKQLQLELREISDSRVERLQSHRAAIESQLLRLKFLKNYLFTQTQQRAFDCNVIQSTPMVKPTVSRILPLPIAFQLSPIVHHTNESALKLQDSLNIIKEDSTKDISGQPVTSIFDGSDNLTSEISTWIGGQRTTFSSNDSGFSQWLNGRAKSHKNEKKSHDNGETTTNEEHNNSLPPLRRSDKHSQHSSLQNIQGDLNDILDRLQNMVANDCLLEDTFSADNNCELKRAATEMEDLLTGLIEGMESRKGKLTTVV